MGFECNLGVFFFSYKDVIEDVGVNIRIFICLLSVVCVGCTTNLISSRQPQE